MHTFAHKKTCTWSTLYSGSLVVNIDSYLVLQRNYIAVMCNMPQSTYFKRKFILPTNLAVTKRYSLSWWRVKSDYFHNIKRRFCTFRNIFFRTAKKFVSLRTSLYCKGHKTNENTIAFFFFYVRFSCEVSVYFLSFFSSGQRILFRSSHWVLFSFSVFSPFFFYFSFLVLHFYIFSVLFPILFLSSSFSLLFFLIFFSCFMSILFFSYCLSIHQTRLLYYQTFVKYLYSYT